MPKGMLWFLKVILVGQSTLKSLHKMQIVRELFHLPKNNFIFLNVYDNLNDILISVNFFVYLSLLQTSHLSPAYWPICQSQAVAAICSLKWRHKHMLLLAPYISWLSTNSVGIKCILQLLNMNIIVSKNE